LCRSLTNWGNQGSNLVLDEDEGTATALTLKYAEARVYAFSVATTSAWHCRQAQKRKKQE